MMDSSDRAEPKSFTEAFAGLKFELSEKIDLVKSGLLDRLEDCKILSSRLRKSIENDFTLYGGPRACSTFMSALEQRPDEELPLFRQALIDSGQPGVAEYLLGRRTSSQQGIGGIVGSNRADIAAKILLKLDNPDIKVQNADPAFAKTANADAYPMDNECRGIACIISVFKTHGLDDRYGTEQDCTRLKTLFKQLKFDVKTFTDDHGLQAEEMLGHIKRTAKMKVNGQKPQCYALFILSHGGMIKSKNERGAVNLTEVVFGNNGTADILTKQEIINTLNTEPNLDGVPRVTLFVCCRSVTPLPSDGVHVPDHFLVGFPCREYCDSYRGLQGTVYVRCLIKVFMERCHDTDAVSLLEKIDGKIQTMLQANDESQSSQTYNSLLKKLYFFIV